MSDIGKYFSAEENELKYLCCAIDKKNIEGKNYLVCKDGVGVNLSASLLGKGHKCSKYYLSNKAIIDNHTTCSICDSYYLLR